MKTLHLHIGSYKTGTTSIQNIFHNNRDKLKKQGIIYPNSGGETGHHKLCFVTKNPREEWQVRFGHLDESSLRCNANEYLAALEADLNLDFHSCIMSTEHLFIEKQETIADVIQYLRNFFSEIIVYVFVRNPIDFYSSGEQEMIRHRSYIKSPYTSYYIFKNVIESWNNFCELRVLQYSHTKNSCQILCEEIGIEYNQLTDAGQRSNTSLSVEQMVLLEKIRRNIYQNEEKVIKPQLRVLLRFRLPFANKPKLRSYIPPIIYQNHKKDLEWLKQNYNIDFTNSDLETVDPSTLPNFLCDHVSVRDVYEVDEQSVERYEALVMDALLKDANQVP